MSPDSTQDLKTEPSRQTPGTSGKIFGSVTSVQIARAIKEQKGYEIDRRRITILDDVKELGTYKAKIDFGKGQEIEVDGRHLEELPAAEGGAKPRDRLSHINRVEGNAGDREAAHRRRVFAALAVGSSIAVTVTLLTLAVYLLLRARRD